MFYINCKQYFTKTLPLGDAELKLLWKLQYTRHEDEVKNMSLLECRLPKQSK